LSIIYQTSNSSLDVVHITANVTNPGSVADLNLDPSDFPALGSGNAAGPTPSNAAANSLLSSYATQASSGGMATQTQQQQGSFFPGHPGRPQREFSAEDFPALGGGAAIQQDGQQFSQQQQQQQQQTNGSLTNGQLQQQQSQAQTRSSQEQASAAAALAHKQSLLGTMSVGAQNQARGVSNAAASTLQPDDALGQKRVGLPSHH
jgi:CCR4-NOT transcription complex subunit 2